LIFISEKHPFAYPLILFNRRRPQTSADINFTFSLADLAKEKQHALRAKN
jgi:hypothetical protein